MPYASFDAISIYRACGAFTRHSQPQAGAVSSVGPTENDEKTVRRSRAFFEDAVEIFFGEQSGVFSESRRSVRHTGG